MIRPAKFAACAASIAVVLFAWIPLACAQEPPLSVPLNRLPARDLNAIAIGGWLLYPTLSINSHYTDNFFFSSTNRLAVAGAGVTPSITAEWTNGIHTTSLYGN